VLGRTQTDVPSDAVALVDEETYQRLTALDGQTLTRMEFAKEIQSAMRPRFDLYAYLRSYAVLEAFRPIFNLERMIRLDLHEWIERLFERVRDTFAPNASRHRYWALREQLQFHDRLERIVVHREDNGLSEVTDRYIQWLGERGLVLGDEAVTQIERAVQTDEITRRRIREWSESQYHLMETLFNFREALQSPTAFVYDPKHLLSDSDTTIYDAIHVAANYTAEWFGDRSAFDKAMKAMQVQAEEADIYCHLQRRRETRLVFSFDYEEQRMPLARFEQIHTRRPVVLRGLKLRAHLPGYDAIYPLAQPLRQAFQDRWVPLLIVRTQDEGRLRALLHGRDIILQYLDVSFAEGTTKYPAIVGTAAFIVHAELERYLRFREKLDDNSPFIVG
jgi:hypothetical protein